MTKKKFVVLALGAALIVVGLVAASERNMQIVASEQVKAGVYSNLALINHRKEEFVLDFLFVDFQEQTEEGRKAYLVARVILSPRHMKRLYNAIGGNIGQYEATFGSIDVP